MGLSWVVFPVVMAALSVGCGLMLDRVAGGRLPGALLPVGGLATLILIARFATASSTTATLATPLVVLAALTGLALNARWRQRSFDGWTLAAALGVFALYAAPVVLSGRTGFTGYIKLDDTATWFAITDRVMAHGSDLSGLGPSTYEATLDAYIGHGYPTGAYLPLGGGRALVGEDVAWVFQPYLSLLAALLAVTFSELASPLVASRRFRAAVVFFAPLAALLYGYTMWGGVKELTAALLIAGLAGFAALLIEGDLEPRRLLPVAVLSAALMTVLSPGGAVWVAPILVPPAVILAGRGDCMRLLRPAGALALLTLLLSLPLVAVGRLLPPVENALSKQDALINLFHPLSGLQLLGIWPVSDFRLRPGEMLLPGLLIAVVALCAGLGFVLAARAKAWGLLLYVSGALVGMLAIVIPGSPWIDAKAMATAAPALPLVALAGAAAIVAGRRRALGLAALAAIGAGVLLSAAFAYQGVNLAPRDRLGELQAIGERVSGLGPTLMTEFEPYGARHFLRNADPEGASELRRRVIPLLGGGTVGKGQTTDTDQLALGGLIVYRTLVLRRSPAQSRPSSIYAPLWAGRYYEVWHQERSPATVLEHLPLGSVVDAGGVPACAEVRRLTRLAGPSGRLAAVPRRAPVVVPASQTVHPRSWATSPPGHYLLPDGAGAIATTVHVASAGTYAIWLGGSVRGRMTVSVDGVQRGSVRNELNSGGQYVELASVPLAAGAHRLVLDYGGPDLHPGSGGAESPIGPIVLNAADADTEVTYVSAARAAGALCGRRWDWIEALR